MNPLLDLKQDVVEDESIVSYEDYEIYPESGTQLDTAGNITITMHNQAALHVPSDACLEFEGQVVQATDQQPFANAVQLAFVNYGILFLFDQIKYLLNATPVETVFNPGVVANVMALATFPANFNQGLIEGWAPDEDGTLAATNSGFIKRRDFLMKADPVGSFRFLIPLKRLFGFNDDYLKSMYGVRHSIVLTRSTSSNDALIQGEMEDRVWGEVSLKNLRLMIPKITTDPATQLTVMKMIKERAILTCAYRMRQYLSTNVDSTTNVFEWRLGVRTAPEQPRYIFVMFQTGKRDKQDEINTRYDHLSVEYAHAFLNNERYPKNDFITDFAKNFYDNQYRSFSSFRKKFYGIDPLISPTTVNALSYKDNYPIFLFDVSKQCERLKTGVTDITLQFRFAKVPDADTRAHAVLISDRKLKLESDGEKMSVVF